MNPQISIILPAYNAEKYLATAIESILQQSFKDFEFIILNDGSTDNTEKIILSYTDSRIRYIKNEKNLKLIKTLNKGIELAKGKYIARMDADDIALPTMLEECYTFFETHPEYSIVAPSVYNMDNDGRTYKKGNNRYSSEVLPYILLFENVVTHPGIMLKADILKKYQYEDSGLVTHFEDYDCWNRSLADGHKIYVLPRPLLLYRINNEGISLTHSDERSKLLRKRQVEWIKRQTNINFNVALIDNLNKNPSWKNIFLLDKELNLILPLIPSHKVYKEFIKWKSIYLYRHISNSLYKPIFIVYCLTHSKLSFLSILNKFIRGIKIEKTDNILKDITNDCKI